MKILLPGVFMLLVSAITAQSNAVVLKDGSGATIGQYASITAAYGAIPTSITQPYIIELLELYNGTAETFPLVLNARNGASALNTITIRPAAGNTGE